MNYAIPGCIVTDHKVTVPLDWTCPEGPTITVFARELCTTENRHRDLPVLVFLQGGPGGKSPRPNGGPGWLNVALQRYRVLLLDQRGTGRSSAVQARHFATMGADQGALYLSRLRADSIVKDCEHIRKTLFGGRTWSTLGQSYGGFITLSYLSLAPEGLAECFITGGIPGINATAEQIYDRTYPRVAHKNAIFFDRYPQDRALVERLAQHLRDHEVRLPGGDTLTIPRLQQLGLGLGMSDGMESLHWLLDEAFCDDGNLSDSFLAAVRDQTGFDGNPLFAAIHESIYAQHGDSTRWAAQRRLPTAFSPDAQSLLFTGEMIYPWMFRDIAALRPYAAAAEALARMPMETQLYDHARLAANEVPLTAAVYTDDMYVDLDLSLQTARKIGNIRLWITNEHEHDGLRASTAVLQRLLSMRDTLDGANFL